jgi:hypothetical protein
MALKKKGHGNISGRKATTPKAGPKARRAKSEAEHIREAVEEYGVRGVRPSRKAGKVRSYRYKEAPPTPEETPVEGWQPYLREPHELVAYRSELPEDLRPHAAKLFKMECEHTVRDITAVNAPLDPSEREEWWRCRRCWYSAKKTGINATLREEWNSYCPEGFDMWEWADMFTKDRTMWRFIYEEAEYALVADVLGSEEAA